MKKIILILLMTALINLHGSNLVAQWQTEGIVLIPIEPQQFQDKPIVLGVTEGSPAATAGLGVGDLIVTVDGAEISTKGQFVKVIRKKKSEKKSIPLGVLRDGVLQTFIAEFKDPSEKLGIDIGEYFLITGKKPRPLALLQKKGDFGMGINGKVLADEIVKFNIRVDNFSKATIKVDPDYITVTTNGAPLERLSPEEAVDIVYPEPAGLKDLLPSERRKLGRNEKKLLSERRKELKMWRQLELKGVDIPPGKPIIGSLFYKNSHQKYPVNLRIEAGDQVFNFSFDKEIE